VERLALTANTLTYAALGDQLGYWSLYPASAGWGRIPAWGHARVAASTCEAVSVGTLWFGLLPMAPSVVLTVRPSRLGLKVTSVHRAALNPVYNQYSAESDAVEVHLDQKVVFHPLFILSFVLYHYLQELEWMGADQLVVISASSKAALGFAHLVGDAIPLIGVTSSRHLDWVATTQAYQRVDDYSGRFEAIDGSRCVLLDFSGNAELVSRITGVLGGRVARTLRIGFTHARQVGSVAAGDDPAASEVFFGPLHIEARVRQWGAPTFDALLAEAIGRFIAASNSWFHRRHLDGRDSLVEGLQQLRLGTIPPSTLLIARPTHA